MVIFDLETTGYSVIKNEIIEIAGMRVNENFEEIETFESFMKPEKPIPKKITELTGIKQKHVDNAPPPREALASFREFAGDECLIAHNAEKFDAPFLFSQMRRCQLKVPGNTVWDSLPIARYYAKRAIKHNMKYLCEFYKIAREDSHRALSDVRDLQKLLQIFRKDYSLKQIEASANPIILNNLEMFKCTIPMTLQRFANEKSFFRIKGRVGEEVRSLVARFIFAFTQKKQMYFLVRELGKDRVVVNVRGLEVFGVEE